jgi:deoxyribodipyrimidine photo-lyase
MSTTHPAARSAPAIVWFRDDLRLSDNPALARAAKSGRPLCCIYVHDEANHALRPRGAAARWWLHHALDSLDRALRGHGGGLLLLRGPEAHMVSALARDVDASAVYWNRRYAPAQREVDDALRESLREAGLAVETGNSSLLYEPWELETGGGTPFKMHAAFWRAATRLGETAPPQPVPRAMRVQPLPHTLSPALRTHVVELEDLELLPRRPDWAGGLREAWQPGAGISEPGAARMLRQFVDQALGGYDERRDAPDGAATSCLSPYLRAGMISPRQVAHAVRGAAIRPAARDKFMGELGWREFSYHLLYHYPELPRRNFKPNFDAMPWRKDADALRAWQRGMTGYPMVDAGMRQLWRTGWLHNRARMIVASFLVKHLLIDWRVGEAWFWDTLVDADPANNVVNWQWVAGTGPDAAPFFRIFNPVTQGQKYDPDGAYVRRWLPELAQLPDAVIHAPWTAGEDTLAQCGVQLGRDYPLPIVDHEQARQRALQAFKTV